MHHEASNNNADYAKLFFWLIKEKEILILRDE